MNRTTRHGVPRGPITFLLVLPLALALAACGAIQDYLGGADNTEPPAELQEFIPTVTVRMLWRREVGAGFKKQYLKLRPIVDGERVYAADRNGRVSAFDALTGKPVWETGTGFPISGGPGLGEGLVLVGTSDGKVAALDVEDGRLAWVASVSSEVLSPPVANQSMVVARTIDGKMFGLNARDGAREWVYDRSVPALSLRGTSTPAIAGSAVIAGFDSGRLVALTLANGQPLWEARVAVPSGRSELERLVDLDADPIVWRDLVYAVSFQGEIAAIDVQTGTVVWRRDMSSHAGFDIDTLNVYVTDDNSHVWALDRSTSASVWRQQDLTGRSVTSPTSFGEYVVVGDFEGYLHWMHREDGSFAARIQVDDDGIIAPPVATDRTLYVYGAGGYLAALQVEQ